jgi:S1-C subfamily serine protease
MQDGYVVTNAHVVSSAKLGGTVEVTLHNMRKIVGKVHSMDKQTDIAIIKLEASGENLHVARFGSSSQLRAGEFVVAVGSPLHLQDSVTFGIVSAPARHSSELGMTKHK